MKKISVIGGAGFVGTNYCQHLADTQVPFEIIDLNTSGRFPEKSKIADVREIETLRETITGKIVVNLAAVHRDDIKIKSEYFKTNVDGAANIAKVCDEKGISKIIFTSSVAVYGFAPAGTGEDGEINPFNEYGRTKFLAEEKFQAWLADGKDHKSLLIIRPTVIFGEGNRGNVFNLLNQIASGKFVMVGNGRNQKSMAYIGNIVAFLNQCANSDQKMGIYNYIDTPDFDMNSLVSLVRKKLKNKDGVGARLPYSLGLFLGYIADFVASVTGKTLPLSSVRVKKFCGTTAFSSAKSDLNNFQAPFMLQEGLSRTLQSEFVDPDPEREIFYTE